MFSQITFIFVKCLLTFVTVLLVVAYFTYAERRVIGKIQGRFGPNRAGPFGLAQPILDGVKLFFKEAIYPRKAHLYLFLIAPLLSFAPAITTWALIPLIPAEPLANINAGLLMLLALTSLGIYGIIIAGWASNSKYALLGALRSAAQVVSYEIAMGVTFVGVIIAAGSLNLNSIVVAQSGSLWHWYIWPLFPFVIVYWICALAETNRAPFDMAEGESEIVAGFHVEYSSMGFAFFFLAEYANMTLVSFLAALLFFGGWHSPFQGTLLEESLFYLVPGSLWLALKAGFFMFLFLWTRATLPRYRYDQIMQLGWKVLIPVTFFWLFIVILMAKYSLAPWFV